MQINNQTIVIQSMLTKLLFFLHFSQYLSYEYFAMMTAAG